MRSADGRSSLEIDRFGSISLPINACQRCPLGPGQSEMNAGDRRISSRWRSSSQLVATKSTLNLIGLNYQALPPGIATFSGV